MGPNSLDAAVLAVYALFSFLRMGSAYILALGFSYFFGYLAGTNKRAEKTIVPAVDVLQSVPILGFFPVAIVFFISLFKGMRIGVELASVFLIFTSMTWNIFFGVYEAIKTIPEDLKYAAEAFKLDSWLRLTQVALPPTVPKAVYNSMLSWANGWYFLIASEIIAGGSGEFNLPGLGSYLMGGARNGDIGAILMGIFMIALIVTILDVSFWRHLNLWAEKFKYESVPSAVSETIPEDRETKEKSWPEMRIFSFSWLPSSAEYKSKVSSFINRSFSLVYNSIFLSYGFYKKKEKIIGGAFSAGGLLFLFYIALKSAAFLFNLPYFLSIETAQEKAFVFLIPKAIFYSLLRVMAAYVISLAVALPLSAYIAGNEKASHKLLPLIEIMASIPAIAIFPIIVVGIIEYTKSVDIAAVALIITGMLWYLIFNLTGAVKSMPGDLKEAAKAFNITGLRYWKRVGLPAVFPSLATGSITAIGGGWNAIIVAEYITYKGAEYSTLGIGYLLNLATFKLKSTKLLFFALMAMVVVIFLINRLIWRRIYNLAVEKYKISA